MKYIFLDCEMGGIELKYSLLTAYFIVTDHEFKKLGDLYLYVKPDDGDYLVSGQGMGINGIDIYQHDCKAITQKNAGKLLYNFIKEHSNDGKDKLTPGGHAVKGDIEHVIDKLISRGTWENFCSYRMLDTSMIAQFLKSVGKLPEEVSGSIESLAKHFGIIKENWHNSMSDEEFVTNDLHDAKVDTLVTIRVLQELIKLVK